MRKALFLGFIITAAALGIFMIKIGVAKATDAYGISPPFLHATHLVEGVEFRDTIYIVRDNDAYNVWITTDLSDFPESIRDWIEIGPGSTFMIPKGVRQFPVEIIIKVPKNSGPRDYTQKITFTTGALGGGNEGGDSTGQVAITYGLNLIVNLTVGNEVYRDFRASIDILDIEEGWSPRVNIRFKNKGNVPESFNRATFEVFDQYKAIRLAFIQKVEDFPETPPFTEKDYVVDFPIDLFLGLGEYWGNVVFSQGNSVIAQQETVFKVLEKGSLSKLFPDWGYAVAGSALLLAIIISVIFRRKKRKNSK